MKIQGNGCDWCKHNGRDPEVAVASYTIAIGDQPPKELDFCEPHNDFLRPILAIYAEVPAAEVPFVAEVVHEVVQLPKQAPPAAVPKQEILAIEPPKEGKPSARQIRKPGQWAPGKDMIVCPLPHKNVPADGKNYYIPFGERAGHLKSCHSDSGLLPPEVGYRIPPDIAARLTVVCDKHVVCVKHRYAFESAGALQVHLFKTKNHPGYELVPELV
jgi:hypothetical protein